MPFYLFLMTPWRPSAAIPPCPFVTDPQLPRPSPDRVFVSAQGRPSKRRGQVSVRARAGTCSFDLSLGRVCRCASRRMSACASRRKPSAAEKSHTICIIPHAMLHAGSLGFGPLASCPIDAAVTRRLASKARKVRHGISHGAFVHNIEFKSGNRVTV